MYQYETSPKKLNPEYDIPKSKQVKTKKTKGKTKLSKKKMLAKETKIAKRNFTLIVFFALACILLILYRNVKINESFSEVQAITEEISTLEKENSQITVNIQNSLNLSNIEEAATTTLGMQKLSNKQTVYVSLDTKDYVEVSSDTITEEDEGFWESLWTKFCDLF